MGIRNRGIDFSEKITITRKRRVSGIELEDSLNVEHSSKNEYVEKDSYKIEKFQKDWIKKIYYNIIFAINFLKEFFSKHF